jgi:hypothetical protein
VPDIDLGMRGITMKHLGGNALAFLSPVYVIDGLQRLAAAKRAMAEGCDPLLLSAVLRLGTTEDSERIRFLTLNLDRRKVSSNVVIGGLCVDFPILERLRQLTGSEGSRRDAEFVLTGRVTWTQRSKSGAIMSATTLMRVLGELHAHMGPNTRYVDIRKLASALQELANVITPEVMITNLVYFVDMVDEMWQLGQVQPQTRSAVNHQGFLTAVARLLSDHANFWNRSGELFLHAPDWRKLRTYSPSTPGILELARSGAGQVGILRELRIHMNKGRKNHHLRGHDMLS